MTQGALLILNAIFNNNYCYANPNAEDWATLTIKAENEGDLVMRVRSTDFEMASRLLEISRTVPKQTITEFWRDHCLNNKE